MNEVCTQFVKAEAPVRLKRAMNARIENSPCYRFIMGDKVYFKRVNCDQWKGPAKLIDQDATVHKY